jgi:hypothetical protein
MLTRAQDQLEEHFASLSSKRAPLAYPVYALEHCFDTTEVSALKVTASVELNRYGLLDAHWLVWTALAAEAGYSYAGEEYWPALAQTSHEWRSNDDRNLLRQWFRRFQANYGGPRPVGRWAEQFTIISWPITNAILPRYLQSHFARHLYELRFDLAHLAGFDGDRLGQFLYSSYDGASSRFSDFLQQTDITSRIVLALRDEDQSDELARIIPGVLDRIVTDLEQRRESREYLREAQQVLRARRMSVSARLRLGSEAPVPGNALLSSASQGFLLAARRNSDGNFKLGLIFPDVQSALKSAGIAESALESVRMRLSGPDERWSPGLGLLTLSRRDRRLNDFPSALRPVVELDGANQALTHVLEPLCRWLERPSWVLRHHADGLYREVLGGHVRSGQSYVIVSRVELPEEDRAIAGLVERKANFGTIHAYELNPIIRFTEEMRAALARLHIGSVVGATIDPIGLNPRQSADQYGVTWLSTETVMLRAHADFVVDGYVVALDDGPPRSLAAKEGELLFALEGLPLGEHTLSISIVPSTQSQAKTGSVTSARLDFNIAAPQPWAEAMRARAGFRLLATPSNATLEDVFAGRAHLHVHGPAGREVHWSIETYDAAGHLAQSGGGGTTPVGGASAAVSAALNKLRRSHSEAIDAAHRVDIVVAIDELGRQAMRFPHHVEPLRWSFNPGNHIVHLVDETAHEGPVVVREFDLSAPLIERNIDVALANAGIVIDSPGALMVATYQDRTHSIFVSVPRSQRLQSLAELGFDQSLILPADEATAVVILLQAIQRWNPARPVGQLAIARKVTTLARLQSELASTTCGPDFSRLLRADLAGGLARAQANVGGSPGFGSRMRSHTWPPSAAEALGPFCHFAKTYGIESDDRRCGEAISLAFDPLSLRYENSEVARSAIKGVLANRTLIRGAFLAWATVEHGFESAGFGSVG